MLNLRHGGCFFLFGLLALCDAGRAISAESKQTLVNAPADDVGSLAFPALNGPLKGNPNPLKAELGPLGAIDFTAMASGYSIWQDNAVGKDRVSRVDFTNLQGIVQKAEGPIQFYVQAGLYSIPTLGVPNASGYETTRNLFGFVPEAFVKIAPNDSFSVLAGKLPTLIGPENPFTFQNINIQRGLLFNQTNTINRGAQVNYSAGPVSVSASLNDGFYSDRFTWFTGAISYKFDSDSTLTFDGGTNLSRTNVQSTATPLLQNNSSIYNLIYTYASGPWIITPYLQLTHVGKDEDLGIAESASTYGSALLISHAVTRELYLAGRIEHIRQTGDRTTGTTSLLYGPGSSATSLTFTPTYQLDRFFARAGYSWVKALEVAPGSGFGSTGDKTSQHRFLLEVGVLY